MRRMATLFTGASHSQKPDGCAPLAKTSLLRHYLVIYKLWFCHCLSSYILPAAWSPCANWLSMDFLPCLVICNLRVAALRTTKSTQFTALQKWSVTQTTLKWNNLQVHIKRFPEVDRCYLKQNSTIQRLIQSFGSDKKASLLCLSKRAWGRD